MRENPTKWFTLICSLMTPLPIKTISCRFEVNYAALTKKERVYLAEYPRLAALEQVLRYYRRENHDWSRLKQAEVDVSLGKDEYILAGTIDLIRDESGLPDTVEIADFKSEKKPDLIDDREKNRTLSPSTRSLFAHRNGTNRFERQPNAPLSHFGRIGKSVYHFPER